MALGYVTAGDIANAALDYYVRGKTLMQTTWKKPYLKWLQDNQKEFQGGKTNVSEPVQGATMFDTPGFEQGYSQDDTLNFGQAANILRAFYPWKERHMGLIITWTELKQDGITISDRQKTSQHSRSELTRLTGILENRLADFAESRARALNNEFYADGTQDAKQVPGLLSILTSTPGVGTTGGLNRQNYTWWQHRVALGINQSPAAQTLTKKLRSEIRQLMVFGGQPDAIFAGSQFIEALEAELTEKGQYTLEGFANKGKTDVGVAQIHILGVGDVTFDPTLDIKGLAKYAFFLDSRRIKKRPMEGESAKMLTPERPYNYAVFLRSITETDAFVAVQLNALGVYSVA